MHLAVAGLAAQLPDGLDDEENAESAGVRVGQAAPDVMAGSFPPGLKWPCANISPPAPFAQKPRSSSCRIGVMVKAS